MAKCSESECKCLMTKQFKKINDRLKRIENYIGEYTLQKERIKTIYHCSKCGKNEIKRK